MAEQKRGGFCQHCNAQRVVFRKGTSHLLHLVLTVLTLGLWLLIWVGVSVKFGGWRCSTCGSSKISAIR